MPTMSTTATSHLDKLPTEMWCAIAEHITRPSDLAAFVHVCRFFKDICLPLLYARVLWTDATYEDSAMLLASHPDLVQRVQRFELDSLAFLPRRQSSLLSSLTHANAQQFPPLDPADRLDVPDRLRKVMDLLPRLTGLKTLVLYQVHLPVGFWYDLAEMTGLESLALRNCNTVSVSPRANSGLPLRALRITGLRLTTGSPIQRIAVCSIACAPQLERLDIDGSLAPHAFALMTEYAAARQTPLALRALLTEARTDEPGDFTTIAAFLASTPSIERLYFRRVPKTVTLSAAALPNLRAFGGPAHCIDTFVQGRPVVHIRILDQLPAARHHQNALLTMLGGQQAALQQAPANTIMPNAPPHAAAVHVHPQLHLPANNLGNLVMGAGWNMPNFLPQAAPPQNLPQQPQNPWNFQLQPAAGGVVHVQNAFGGNFQWPANGAHGPGALNLHQHLNAHLAAAHQAQMVQNVQGQNGTALPTGPTWSEIVQVLERVAGTMDPPLERLEFRVAAYDPEILYMTASLFRDLQDLRITWKDRLLEAASAAATANSAVQGPVALALADPTQIDQQVAEEDEDEDLEDLPPPETVTETDDGESMDGQSSEPTTRTPAPAQTTSRDESPWKHGMDSDFMVEFASRFLCEFPQLQVLHLFAENSHALDAPASFRAQTRGHLGLWERFHSRLCEVALASDSVWRKFGPKDWAISRMKGRSSFLTDER